MIGGPEHAYPAAFAANAALLTAVYVLFPVARPALTHEDRLLENLTALTYLAAAVVAAAMTLRAFRRAAREDSRRPPRRVPAFGGAVAVLALVAFGDETSFGLYHFGAEVPKVGDVKLDAAHDTLDVVFRALTRRVPEPLVYVAAFVAVLLVMAAACRLGGILGRVPGLPFVAAAALLAGTAAVLDLRVPQPQPLAFAEELMEFNAAVCLLFAGLSVTRPPDAGPACGPEDISLQTHAAER